MESACAEQLPIVIVDDDVEILIIYRMLLLGNGIKHVVTFSDGNEVLPFLRHNKAAAVILDLTLPTVTGQELLHYIADEYPLLPVIIIRGRTEVGQAVSCMRDGQRGRAGRCGLFRYAVRTEKGAPSGESAMFKHAVVNGMGKGEATVMISGDAVFIHAKEMQSALGEALDACDHLTIDFGRVEVLDFTFRVLLCSLHRRSELVNKRISMQGALPWREDDPVRYTRVKGCLFKGTNERCQLWGAIIEGPAEVGRQTN